MGIFESHRGRHLGGKELGFLSRLKRGREREGRGELPPHKGIQALWEKNGVMPTRQGDQLSWFAQD